jgi:hypothetical protein
MADGAGTVELEVGPDESTIGGTELGLGDGVTVVVGGTELVVADISVVVGAGSAGGSSAASAMVVRMASAASARITTRRAFWALRMGSRHMMLPWLNTCDRSCGRRVQGSPELPQDQVKLAGRKQ